MLRKSQISNLKSHSLIAASIIAASTSSLAVADQISPNPNYGTIHLSSSSEVYENYLAPFENFGSIFIHPNASLLNYGDLQNNVGGQLWLLGGDSPSDALTVIKNLGSLSNAGFMHLGYDAEISGDGSINNSGYLDAYNSENISSSSINNSGDFYSSFVLKSSVITNSGFFVGTGAVFSETLTNSGSFDGASFMFAKTFTNSGTFKNTGSFMNLNEHEEWTFGLEYIQTNGQTINHGQLGFLSIEILGGSLSGTGVLMGDVTIGSSATVIPGSSPGTLSIDGDLHSSGNYVFEIAGLNSGQYDVLDIDGNAFFTGGNFKFDFIDGFIPSVGDHWDFLVADSLNGLGTVNFTYAGLGSGLGIDLHSEGGKISLTVITAVPEPETYAMLLAGLGLMGFMTYRRKQKEAA
ncbi:PEP-CTERM sorting domain-containing protein [Nitrosomonas sp.]|uniref:PEP-CTERM sorting domain-containing protein n=1 Tax=Nitrosomonas sp. TaxID=42353 RepID=UPI0032EB72A2